MNKNLSNTTRIIIGIEFIVVIYMIIALTTSEFNSYKIQEYIKEFEQQNQLLAEENEKLLSKYEYFTSPEYQEKIAKQNFGLVNRGEKILIIPDKINLTPEEAYKKSVLDEKLQFYEEMANPLKWWYYFFM